MPGGQAPAPRPASEEPQQLEPLAVLRPVQNKIRNLRKKIDTATALEDALARGEKLQADQLESVRSKSVKTALLADLEEILKKQRTIAEDIAVQAGVEKPVKDSKRAAKKREKAAAAAAAAEAKSAVSSSSNDATGDAKAPEAPDSEPGVSLDGPIEAQQVSEATGNGPSHESESDSISTATATAVKKVLDLLHVVDYLKETPDGKASVLSYFASRQGSGQDPRMVSAYEIDLLFYFSTMLTSPDGNIAHAAAVDTSTAHCLAYLQEPDAEAFTGTTYGTLADIVKAVGECPLLAQRGDPAPVPEAKIAFGSGGFVAADSAIAAVGPVDVTQSTPDVPPSPHDSGDIDFQSSGKPSSTVAQDASATPVPSAHTNGSASGPNTIVPQTDMMNRAQVLPATASLGLVEASNGPAPNMPGIMSQNDSQASGAIGHGEETQSLNAQRHPGSSLHARGGGQQGGYGSGYGASQSGAQIGGGGAQRTRGGLHQGGYGGRGGGAHGGYGGAGGSGLRGGRGGMRGGPDGGRRARGMRRGGGRGGGRGGRGAAQAPSAE